MTAKTPRQRNVPRPLLGRRSFLALAGGTIALLGVGRVTNAMVTDGTALNARAEGDIKVRKKLRKGGVRGHGHAARLRQKQAKISRIG